MKRILFLAGALLCLASCKSQEDTPFADAKWIGSSESVLYSDFLPQFTLSADIVFDEGSSRASVLFGANDPRLMDRNLNILDVENAKDESYVRIELDREAMCVNVYRTGYTPQDCEGKLFQSLAIPADSIPETVSEYRLVADVALSEIKLSVNGIALGQSNVGPLGHGGDYIAYPQMAEVGYAVEEGQSASFRNYQIRERRQPNALLFALDEVNHASGVKKLFDPDHGGMPMLRASFSLKDKAIRSATLYATARGIYRIHLNGSKLGKGEYAPGLSQYNKHHYYQSYDVAELLKSGDNQFFAELGEGWWSGDLTFGAGNRNYFGDQLALLACLDVEYEDGGRFRFVTDPETWEVSNDGPVVYASMFQGEVYDAGKSIQDASWRRAEEMSLEGHISSETFGSTAPRVDDYSDFQLVPQEDPDPAVFTVLQARSVSEVRPGVFVYDMGQNFAGIPSVSLKGLEKGRQLRFRYAEVLYPENGMLMLENIRGAMAQDIYIASGAETELFEPYFTQHGYRYMEISGLDEALPLEAVKGLVISSVQNFTAHYECSNPLVNRLWQNIQWSMLANFISIPTDCPQRNERMGWSGDLSVFSRTATYLSDVNAFLRRHTQAIRDVQMPDGRMPDVAPIGGAFGGLLWGSAGITVPYECYRQYADTSILEMNYEAMHRYMDYIEEKYYDAELGLLTQGNLFFGGLGDWLGPQNGRIDNTALWEAYYIFDLQIMKEAASVLGKTDDENLYDELLSERKEHWVRTYLDPLSAKFVASEYMRDKAGQLIDVQSSYVLPLAFGLIDDAELRAKVAANLADCVRSSSVSDNGVNCPPYSLMTGFITTAWISKALSDNGYSDLAYRLLQQTSYPSWLYPVTQGATTIWERLDSYTIECGFGGNNSMNSFNHYSFGAVGQWLIAYSLGIDRDENAPGFKHFVLHPVPDPNRQMTYARGWYDSREGRIESSWEYQSDGSVKYSFVIPEGCTATLKLSGRPDEELSAGKYVR